MNTLTNILQDLESLPAEKREKREEVCRYIRALKDEARLNKKAVLDRAFEKVNSGEAERLAKVIDEGCEQIDATNW